MAKLNPTEKELLPVVRYVNSNRRNVLKMVQKLTRHYDMETVCSMTGFTEEEVKRMLASNSVPGKKPKTRRIEGQLEPTGNVEPRFNVDVLPGRIAQELFEQWGTRFRSGDQFITAKQMMTEKEITSKTATEVFSVLREDGLIEFAEPGNYRKGYVVK